MSGVARAVSGVWGALTGKTPDAPQMPPPPPPMNDPAVAKANQEKADAAAEQERLRGNRGRASTILTGSSGLSDKATTARQTLIGD